MPPVFPLPNASTDLTGQTAFVTGTTSGLGRRFAKVLAAAGANVAVAARRADRLQELVAEITKDGGRAAAVPLDVTDSVDRRRNRRRRAPTRPGLDPGEQRRHP